MAYMGSNDGYLYALNIDKKSAPTSIFAYYIVGGAIVLIAVLIVLRKLGGRKKK
jgi:hypothetical protein